MCECEWGNGRPCAARFAETYRLIGRAMVKCVMDGAAVPDLLAPSVYKYLLGERAHNLRDLQAFHPAEARKLRQILAGSPGVSQGAGAGNSSSSTSSISSTSASTFHHRGSADANPPLPPGPAPAPAPPPPPPPPPGGEASDERARRVHEAVERELVGGRSPALAALRAGFSEVDLSAYLGVFTADDLRELITATTAPPPPPMLPPLQHHR